MQVFVFKFSKKLSESKLWVPKERISKIVSDCELVEVGRNFYLLLRWPAETLKPKVNLKTSTHLQLADQIIAVNIAVGVQSADWCRHHSEMIYNVSSKRRFNDKVTAGCNCLSMRKIREGLKEAWTEFLLQTLVQDFDFKTWTPSYSKAWSPSTWPKATTGMLTQSSQLRDLFQTNAQWMKTNKTESWRLIEHLRCYISGHMAALISNCRPFWLIASNYKVCYSVYRTNSRTTELRRLTVC